MACNPVASIPSVLSILSPQTSTHKIVHNGLRFVSHSFKCRSDSSPIVLGNCSLSSPRFSGCNVRAQNPSAASVSTAVRLVQDASVVRVMGPGSNVNGFGKLLAMDEFFMRSINNRDSFAGSVSLDSLIYYLEEEKSFENDEDTPNPRHGVQVVFRSSLAATTSITSANESYKQESQSGIQSMICHVREASAVQSLQIETDNGKGGASVRVVAGEFGGLASQEPLNHFVFLDVLMRSGSQAQLPLKVSHGFLVYILEGVGIFRRNDPSSCSIPFYENEGHAIWFPPLSQNQVASDILIVATHPCSTLRFILLGSPL